MKAICGLNCNECELLMSKKCKGCKETNGCPFGKKCFIANYISIGGKDSFEKLKDKLVDEFNSLNVEGMKKIDKLYPLNGAFVNLEYTLPNKEKVKFLKDDEIYLGTQVECEFNDGEIKKCFGLVANLNFLLICEYEENGNKIQPAPFSFPPGTLKENETFVIYRDNY